MPATASTASCTPAASTSPSTIPRPPREWGTAPRPSASTPRARSSEFTAITASSAGTASSTTPTATPTPPSTICTSIDRDRLGTAEQMAGLRALAETPSRQLRMTWGRCGSLSSQRTCTLYFLPVSSPSQMFSGLPLKACELVSRKRIPCGVSLSWRGTAFSYSLFFAKITFQFSL
jgi:hypothetical protein